MTESDVCCPVFDPKPWDEVTHHWENKLFMMTAVPQLFHMPLPGIYSKTITKMWQDAEACGIAPPTSDFMLMAYDPSPWKSELYMTITKEDPSVNCVKMTGTFVTKVFDGSYGQVPKYLKALEAYLSEQGQTAEKYYFYYTTCPKCAKKYGHNYIVAIAQIK